MRLIRDTPPIRQLFFVWKSKIYFVNESETSPLAYCDSDHQISFPVPKRPLQSTLMIAVNGSETIVRVSRKRWENDFEFLSLIGKIHATFNVIRRIQLDRIQPVRKIP